MRTPNQLLEYGTDHYEVLKELSEYKDEELLKLNVEMNLLHRTYTYRASEAMYLRGVITTLLRQRGKYK